MKVIINDLVGIRMRDMKISDRQIGIVRDYLKNEERKNTKRNEIVKERMWKRIQEKKKKAEGRQRLI